MSLRNRVAAIGLAIESTEGTEETLANANAVPVLYDPSYTPDIGRFERDPARNTFSKLPPVIGRLLGTIAWRTEIAGGTSITSAPPWAAALKACGFAEYAVKTQSIGTVTGTFRAGEKITDAGTFEGRIVKSPSGGTLTYIAITGALADATEITGAVSGATVTTSAAATSDQGFAYVPITDSVPSVTVGRYLDGKVKKILGARGNVGINLVGGQPGFFDFSFLGGYVDWDDATVLSPSVSGLPTAPTFRGVTFALGTGTARCFTTFDIDMGNELTPRDCALQESLVASVLLTNRNPTGSYDPESELPSVDDYAAALIAGTQLALEIEWGSVAGNTIVIASPTAVIDDLAEGDRSGIALAQTGLRFCTQDLSSGDDELLIAVI